VSPTYIYPLARSLAVRRVSKGLEWLEWMREESVPSPLFRFLTRCVRVRNESTVASREKKPGAWRKRESGVDERNEHAKYANLFETNSQHPDSRRHKLPYSHHLVHLSSSKT
jgi:hypothetical protein